MLSSLERREKYIPRRRALTVCVSRDFFFFLSSAPREVRESPKGGVPDVPKEF